MSAAVAASRAGLSALIYMIKRLYITDLELRTAREEQRAIFHEAKARADAAAAGRPIDPELQKVADAWEPRPTGVRWLVDTYWRLRRQSPWPPDPEQGPAPKAGLHPVGTVRAVLDDHTSEPKAQRTAEES